MKMSKFKIAVLTLICILVCATIYVSLGIVNGIINPLVGLFTVLFLWAFWRATFKSRSWANRFQCVAFLLCIVTVVYTLAFYQSYINYQIWVQERLQEYPAYIRPWVDFTPFWGTKTAGYLMLVGFGLFGLWILLFTYSDKLKGKPAVNPLEARHRLALSEGQKENNPKEEAEK